LKTMTIDGHNPKEAIPGKIVTCGDNGNGTSFACTMTQTVARNLPTNTTIINQKGCYKFDEGAGHNLGCNYYYDVVHEVNLVLCFCNTDLCNKDENYGLDLDTSTRKPSGAILAINILLAMHCIAVYLIFRAF